MLTLGEASLIGVTHRRAVFPFPRLAQAGIFPLDLVMLLMAGQQ